MKFLRLAPDVEPGPHVARFRREAELMATVSHPNIVTIFDFGLAEGVPYLAMEFVAGGDFRGRMVPKVAMPAAEVLAIVRPVTSALQCLHDHGILHRDLKPENILMARDEAPKVADFGIAVVDASVGALTATGQVMGSVGYVAPEQQYRLPLDERADQYSLAAVSYELLTGQKPLGTVAPPSRLNPDLGPAVDAALMRGLSEEREDRFATIREFGEALALALEGIARRRRRRPFRPFRPFGAATALGAILLGMFILLPGGGGRAVVRPSTATGKSEAFPTPKSAPRTFSNTLGMTMIRVDAGEFVMGSPESEKGEGAPLEKPAHRVRITRPYYLSSCEVTVEQFRAFIDATGLATEPERNGRGGTVFDPSTKSLKNDPSWNWRNPGYQTPQKPDEPVVQVTWADASGFCQWLSLRERREYRLPSEAEWEYACRAGTTTRWSVGDDPEGLDHDAWTSRNAEFVAHPVGLKHPNPFGFHDMHGNVWEWCQDFEGAYSAEAQDDPKGPAAGSKRVLRGGGWDWGTPGRTRSASRLFYPPSSAYYAYGFRICSPVAP